MKKLTETRKNKAVKFLNSLEHDYIDIVNNIEIDRIYSDMEDGETAYQSILTQLDENNVFDIEIIYYSSAMEYLMENDCSLCSSLEIAGEMGYSPESLNSETLASLLASQLERENFDTFETEINEFFNELFN
jgi:hypothetical protein